MHRPSRRGPLLITLIVVAFLMAGFWVAAKKPRWNGIGRKAEKYFTQNKFNEAIIEYKNVVQLNPKDAQAHYKLGLPISGSENFRRPFPNFPRRGSGPEFNGCPAAVRLSLLLASDIPKARAQMENIVSKNRKTPAPIF